MTTTNPEIAAIFEQVADLLEFQGTNPFRVRAYRNAAGVAGVERSEPPESWVLWAHFVRPQPPDATGIFELAR